MSYFPKPSLNENDLAIIERGDTAAHSIDAGQYVSWHGRTGKAKAAILQGATLSDSLFDYDDEGTLNELNASLTGYIEGSWSWSEASGGARNYGLTGITIPQGYKMVSATCYANQVEIMSSLSVTSDGRVGVGAMNMTYGTTISNIVVYFSFLMQKI